MRLKLIFANYKKRFFNNPFINRFYGYLLHGKSNSTTNYPVNSNLINSFSQYGEDLVLDGIFGNKPNGFFIDIGANDPIIFNNSKRFYDRGWTGINIEPNPILFRKLVEQRSRDTNLNIGVGPLCQKLPFYLVSADTLSSFDIDDAKQNCSIFNEKIVGITYIQMLPLVEIFEKFTNNQYVDFISIDVEGYEIGILQSNDWNKYRPQLILIEITNHTSEIISFLNDKEYELVFKNSTNGIFLDKHHAVSKN